MLQNSHKRLELKPMFKPGSNKLTKPTRIQGTSLLVYASGETDAKCHTLHPSKEALGNSMPYTLNLFAALNPKLP